MRILLLIGVLLYSAALSAQTRVFYAGSSGKERFHDVHELSDGSYLIAGSAQDLSWVAAAVPRITLSNCTIQSTAAGQIGFVLHVDADFSNVLQVAQFGVGTVQDVFKIRSTELPGQNTGTLFISGTRETGSAASGGYFVAKLDQNFVGALPSACSWSYDVLAEGDYKALQPWDVGGDGKVVFGSGNAFDPDWAIIHRLSGNGLREAVPNWTAHWGSAGEQDVTPASSYVGTIEYSGVVMKAGRRGSLRSFTQGDFDLTTDDGNGNVGRKGRFPDDYYFSGPCPLTAGSCPGGPGYTGYSLGTNPTQRVGGIVVDRRDNHIYFGYSTQTRLPGGNPDFEPAVVAMTETGALKWWNRLYRETAQNSSPDQYVDGVAIDYARNELVVLARSHGNNTQNFWSGDGIAAVSGEQGFQNRFTGTNGNIHISWLGKFALAQNQARAATWVAEYVEGSTNFGPVFTDPLLSGWPNPSTGNPDLNTTRNCGELLVRRDGSVVIACQGRRTITTHNAWQEMPVPSSGLTGSWNYFVRVYKPDLSGVAYSSLLTGNWNTANGQGGDNTRAFGLADSDDAVIAVGYHRRCDTSTTGVCTGLGADSAVPNAMPTTAAPSWGTLAPQSESAWLARLSATTLVDGFLFANGFE